jgi:hypothetical protein
MEARLDVKRRLDYHTKYLQQVAKSNFQIDVAWNLEAIRKSLAYIAEHGDEAGSNAVLAAGKIFSRTRDEETRRACLESLVKIASPKARNELLRISQNKDLEPTWKDTVNSYLSQVNQTPAPTPVTSNSVKTETGRFVQQ